LTKAPDWLAAREGCTLRMMKNKPVPITQVRIPREVLRKIVLYRLKVSVILSSRIL